MIIEGIVLGGTYFMSSIIKSCNMDERALKKYSRAFEKNEEAKLMVKDKAEFTDKRLVNVLKKKKAIMNNTFPKFVDVYSQIQKIDLGESNNVLDKFSSSGVVNKIAKLQSLSIELKKNFTNKEFLCSLFNIVTKDSERFLSAASSQLRAANVVYSQAESICTVYDSIIARADRISDLLVKMNFLFIKSIEEMGKTIDKNGLDVRQYSDYDKGVLMTGVNLAAAIADIINVPVVTDQGEIPEEALKTIEIGEKYINQINEVISNY